MEKSALIIIDLQGLTKLFKNFTQPYSFETILGNNERLIKKFEQAENPVYLLSVELQIFPKHLKKYFNRLLLENVGGKPVVKFGPSAFSQSDYPLAEELKAAGVSRLYISGISTNNGVLKTAEDGEKLGFETFIVDDASAALSRDLHETALGKFGKMVQTSELL